MGPWVHSAPYLLSNLSVPTPSTR